jgi:thiamine-monophosphate kinase
MNEFDLIAEYFAPLATAPGAFGLKDDAAAIPPNPDHDLIVTTDQIAAATDFFSDDPASLVAQKSLRVNLSDLAAKGAVPAHYLLTLALPAGLDASWLKAFSAGLARDQQMFGISLLGGDTARTDGPLSITVTAFGWVPQGQMIRRAGARAGDCVYVTGTIGDSGGGLAILKGEPHALDEAQKTCLTDRYRLPQPPVAFGPLLRGLAGAAADVSDGLIADLGHVARASGARVVLDAATIPRSAALRALWGEDEAALLRAVTAGDDYQIAFTADPMREAAIMAAAANSGVALTRIGRVEAGEGVDLRRNGRILRVPSPGFRHF